MFHIQPDDDSLTIDINNDPYHDPFFFIILPKLFSHPILPIPTYPTFITHSLRLFIRIILLHLDEKLLPLLPPP